MAWIVPRGGGGRRGSGRAEIGRQKRPVRCSRYHIAASRINARTAADHGPRHRTFGPNTSICQVPSSTSATVTITTMSRPAVIDQLAHHTQPSGGCGIEHVGGWRRRGEPPPRSRRRRPRSSAVGRREREPHEAARGAGRGVITSEGEQLVPVVPRRPVQRPLLAVIGHGLGRPRLRSSSIIRPCPGRREVKGRLAADRRRTCGRRASTGGSAGRRPAAAGGRRRRGGHPAQLVRPVAAEGGRPKAAGAQLRPLTGLTLAAVAGRGRWDEWAASCLVTSPLNGRPTGSARAPPPCTAPSAGTPCRRCRRCGG